jgi:hypothetical protein
MSEPVNIWIVEDWKDDASDAWQVVDQVSRDVGGDAVISWGNDFAWPPKMRGALDMNQEPSERVDYPDIVLLDLCKLTRDGEKLQADDYYTAFRKWEGHKPEGRPALIILWSLHQGRQDTDRFVKRTTAADSRVIALASKRPELLRSELVEVWRRVMEERDNA